MEAARLSTKFLATIFVVGIYTSQVASNYLQDRYVPTFSSDFSAASRPQQYDRPRVGEVIDGFSKLRGWKTSYVLVLVDCTTCSNITDQLVQRASNDDVTIAFPSERRDQFHDLVKRWPQEAFIELNSKDLGTLNVLTGHRLFKIDSKGTVLYSQDHDMSLEELEKVWESR
jgi:hypothetical protein